jgi:Transposase IS200 like
VTTPIYRRSRHSVSLPHAHLVFVTQYRRCVFTDAMLTFTEHTMGDVCVEHGVDSLSSTQKPTTSICSSPYPPTRAIADLVQRLKWCTPFPMLGNFALPVSAPESAATSDRRPNSRPLPRRTPVHHQATQRCTTTTALAAGLRPTTNGTSQPRTEVRGLHPRSRSHR